MYMPYILFFQFNKQFMTVREKKKRVLFPKDPRRDSQVKSSQCFLWGSLFCYTIHPKNLTKQQQC